MSPIRRLSIAIMLFAGLILASRGAWAQGDADCNAYTAIVAASTANAPSVVPDSLLSDPETATQCLIGVVKRIGASTGADGLTPDNTARLLSATGALRALMLRGATPSDPFGEKSAALAKFIGDFRGADDLDVASALSYAARSDNKDLRLNAVLIFSNVVDNATVCVPLAHLNDAGLASTDSGRNGRANLLGIVSVVAPWANHENFDSISKTAQAIKSSVGNDSTNFGSTLKVIGNINARLGSQGADSNKSAPLADDLRSRCSSYIKTYFTRSAPSGVLDSYIRPLP